MKTFRLQKLMEEELDKAESILAVKDLGDDVQGMAEDIAKMRVDKLMPLVEKIKEQFDQSTGDRFQNEMDSVLEQLQDNLIQTKNKIDDQVAVLSGDKPAEEPFDDEKPDFDTDLAPEDDETDLDDLLGGDDTMAGEDEPMGRMRRESKLQHLKNRIKILEKKLQKRK